LCRTERTSGFVVEYRYFLLPFLSFSVIPFAMKEAEFPQLSQAAHQAIRQLHKKSEREAQRLFFIEGEKLCREALQSSAPLEYCVVSATAPESLQIFAHELSLDGVQVYYTHSSKFEQLCDAATPQGIMGVVRFLDSSITPTEPLLVLDGVADPGNVGTIIRTAEWFGVRNILLGAGCADRYNPKTLRSTMGSLFRCAVETTTDLASTLRTRLAQHRIYGASADGAIPLEKLSLDGESRYAIVMGSESHGISPDVMALLTNTVSIGGVTRNSENNARADGAESLNVAVATGIVLHHCFGVARKPTVL
jgi:RNA methyltransferase, TrmH family